MPRETIFAAIEHELFRQTALPLRGGGLDQGKHDAGQKFPGSRPPSLGVMGNPAAVKPVVDNLRDAGEYASRIMRGVGHSPAPAEPPVSNGRAVPPPAVAVPDNAPRERSPAEARLNAALMRQSELASIDAPTAEQDQRYAEAVREVAQASAAVEAEKKGNAHV